MENFINYKETNLVNNEKEVVINPTEDLPVLLHFHSNTGIKNICLFKGDIARLNFQKSDGLYGTNTYIWFNSKNKCSICVPNHHFAIVSSKSRSNFYVFQINLHDGYLDNTKLVKIFNISDFSNRKDDFKNALRWAYDNLTNIKDTSDDDLNNICNIYSDNF